MPQSLKVNKLFVKLNYIRRRPHPKHTQQIFASHSDRRGHGRRIAVTDRLPGQAFPRHLIRLLQLISGVYRYPHLLFRLPKVLPKGTRQRPGCFFHVLVQISAIFGS